MTRKTTTGDLATVRGKKISVDAKGFICLTDIWNAAGYSKITGLPIFRNYQIQSS